jgi:hypothetical protein
MIDIVEVMARWMCRADGGFPDGASDLHDGKGGYVFVKHWEDWRDEARAAIAALDAHGFAIVPKEPTEAMIDAAFDAIGEGANEVEAERAQYRRAFKLMLAAAKGECG